MGTANIKETDKGTRQDDRGPSDVSRFLKMAFLVFLELRRTIFIDATRNGAIV